MTLAPRISLRHRRVRQPIILLVLAIALTWATGGEAGAASLMSVGPPIPTGGGRPSSLAVGTSNGMLLATVNAGDPEVVNDGSLSTFSLSSSGLLTPTSNLPAGSGVSVAFSPKGLLALGTWTGTFATFTFSAAGVPIPAVVSPGGTVLGQDSLAFSPNGEVLASTSRYAKSIATFSVSSAGAVSPLGTSVHSGTDGGPISIAFSPDGRVLAAANNDLNNWTFNTYTVSSRGVLAPATTGSAVAEAPWSIAFSPDGRLLALAARGINARFPGVVQIFRMSGATAVPVGVPISMVYANSVAFSPDGNVLVAAGSDGIALFLVEEDGRLTPVGTPAAGTPDHPDDAPSDVAFSPDGRFIVALDPANDAVLVFPLTVPTLDTVISAAAPTTPIATTTTADFTFAANYPATLECRLDAGSFDPCTSPVTYPDLDEGHHTFTVRARDLLGHLESTPATRSWIVDRTAPDAPGLNAPADAAPAVAATAPFTWSPTRDNVTGVDRYELLIDDRPAVPVVPDSCAALCRVVLNQPLSDGAHRWRVTATDGAENTSTSSTRQFTVDATPPDPFTLDAPADGTWVGTHQPRLSWQAPADAGSGASRYALTIDGALAGQHSLTATSWTPPVDLADGLHRWQVTAYDVNGNERTSAAQTFVVDTAAPAAALVAMPDAATSGRDVAFDASGSSDAAPGAVTAYEWDLDGDGTFETTTPGPNVTHAYTTTVPFTVPVSVQVTDRVGLTATATRTVRVVPTSTPRPAPGVAIEGGARCTKDLNVTLGIVAPAFATKLEIANDAAFASAPSSAVAAKLPWKLATAGGAGVRKVFVRFTRGLIVGDSYNDDIILDQTPPVIQSATKMLRKGRATLHLTTSDRGPCEIDGVQVANEKAHPQKGYVKVTFRSRRAQITPTGIKVRKPIYVRVRDMAGNAGPWVRVRSR